MFHQKESVFRDKFNLLCTPEETEVINWSSSGSSDYENINTSNKQSNLFKKSNNRKRKRKPKAPKNISYLDVTIIDVPDSGGQKSPVLEGKKEKIIFNTSPILSSQSFCNINSNVRTPIAAQQGVKRSPLLTHKMLKQRSAEKLKKRLFLGSPFCHDSERSLMVPPPLIGEPTKHEISLKEADKSPIIASKTKTVKVLNKPKGLALSPELIIKSEIILSGNSPIPMEHFHETPKSFNKRHKTGSYFYNKILDITEIKQDIKTKEEFDYNNFSIKNEQQDSNANGWLQKNKFYFKNEFSSDSPSQSQPSITETQTPQNDTDTTDIQIVSSLTQNPRKISSDIINTISTKTSMDSLESDVVWKSKKVKYKKDSLAFRLNSLLRKQSADISLWHHEQYLADNTSFVIPKREFIIFRIRNVSFEFGCYLLDAIDLNDESFLIFINKNHINNVMISNEFLFKVYEPYYILESIFSRKVVLNVCKFEFLPLDSTV